MNNVFTQFRRKGQAKTTNPRRRPQPDYWKNPEIRSTQFADHAILHTGSQSLVGWKLYGRKR